MPLLMSVKQAIEIIDATPVFPRIERLPLAAARGCRLAEDLTADRDYPPFDKSLMDGYAVRSADLRAAAATPARESAQAASRRQKSSGDGDPAVRPAVELKVVGEVAAGKWPDRAVGAGEAIAIMTGAPLPDGADAVVPVEDVEMTPSALASKAATAHAAAGSIGVRKAIMPGAAIARRGSDCLADAVVLLKGTELGAAQIAVAATVGAAEVAVFSRPRVGVLGTGDELVPVDQTPGPAQIRNSNTLMLIALLQRMGCEVSNLGTVPDEPAAIRRALEQGLRLDAVFVTGGMSMGAYDYVPRLLVELGVVLKITKVRLKPGKPFVFGVKEGLAGGSGFGAQDSGKGGESPEMHVERADQARAANPWGAPTWSDGRSSLNPEPGTLNPSYVFGLPGNPVSAFVCTLRLASRLLARIGGGQPGERWVTGRLETGLAANGPREFYQPVVRSVPPGGTSAKSELAHIKPLSWKGSADLFTLASANALLIRGENEPPVPQGTMVRVLEF